MTRERADALGIRKKTPLIHVLGGGQWQLYTVELAKRLGYRVLVTDMYPQRPAYGIADYHEVVDITDLKGTLSIAEKYRIDGIICDTTDVGVPTMAYVAEKLGLPGIGYDVALNFTDKARMRQLSQAAGVSNPKFSRCHRVEDLNAFIEEVSFPVFVKPVDSQSSRGVGVIGDWGEVPGVFAEALRNSRQSSVIAEQFMNGIETTVESLCIDGRVHCIGISDKGHFRHRPGVANRLTYPAVLNDSVLAKLKTANEKTIRSLGLRTGVTHAEFMIIEGEPFLVEIAARGGGSHVYSHIVPYLAGIPVVECYLNFLMGDALTEIPDNQCRAANLAFFDFPEGKVKRILGDDQVRKLEGVELLLLEFQVGSNIHLPTDDRSRLGQIVVFGNSRNEVLSITETAFQTLKVEIE